jgi:hypothetical protein
MKKIAATIVMGIVALFILIQLVPYGRQHTNPPVVKEPNWGSPQARQIAQRACFDCHSNETVWPWYTNIAPVSWLIQNHVEEGRRILNFSDWTGQIQRRGRTQDALTEIKKTMLEGEMPMGQYVMIHPEAKLTTEEMNTLIQGLSTPAGQ